MPTPIFVISGFLGAGKTTLINHLLESAPDSARIMVLVNEFGKISIDKKMIKTDPSKVVDLSGGCICCGMLVELIASLRIALDDLKAEVVLIESTGLAVPQEIVRKVLSPVFEGRVAMGGIITIVDAGSVLEAGAPIIEAQLKGANVAIINKTDLIDRKMLAEVRDRIKSITNQKCRLLETSFGRISYSEIFAKPCDSSHMADEKTQPGEVDSTKGFAAVCLMRSSPVKADELIKFYQEQRRKIIRSKGFVMTEKGGLEVQLSKGGIEVKAIQQPIHMTELVLIVREENKEFIEGKIKKLFDQRDGIM